MLPLVGIRWVTFSPLLLDMVVTKTVRRQRSKHGKNNGADDAIDNEEEEEKTEEGAEEIQIASYDGQEAARVRVTTTVESKPSLSTVFAPL